MGIQFYKCIDGELIECELMEWAQWMEAGDHVLWQQSYERDKSEIVSTSFLGFEHSGGMFETMHFPGNELRRCHTYEGAKEQHHEMVIEWLKDVN